MSKHAPSVQNPDAFKIQIGPNEALCDCGCRKIEVRNKMTMVEKQNHFRTNGREEVGVERRWFVRKLCKPHFLQEMNMLESLKEQASLFALVPVWRDLLKPAGFAKAVRYWWTLITSAWSFYSGMYFVNERRFGVKRARRTALRFTARMVLPDWAITGSQRVSSAWSRFRAAAGPTARHPEQPFRTA